MKIVLLQDIKSLGRKGEIKNVANGYALNFILPKKLGTMATAEAIVKIEAEKALQIKISQELQVKNRSIIESLKDLELELKVKEQDGKLFGSIHPKDIAQELQKHNFDIQEKCIKIEEVIKKTGEYKITIDFGNNISTPIILQVTGISPHTN